MDDVRGFFLTWLKHYVIFSHSSKENKSLLILDGHISHTKNLSAVNYAREKGVTIVTLPPHTTHKMQPLDVSFFGPFKGYYNRAIITMMRTHPGVPITVKNVPELLYSAFRLAANINNIVNGFKATGIWPLSIDVFSDLDFAPSLSSNNVSYNNIKSHILYSYIFELFN